MQVEERKAWEIYTRVGGASSGAYKCCKEAVFGWFAPWLAVKCWMVGEG
jgi:hypothetical protein